MLGHTPFGWPLICGGVAKSLYDILLLAKFRSVKLQVDEAIVDPAQQ